MANFEFSPAPTSPEKNTKDAMLRKYYDAFDALEREEDLVNEYFAEKCRKKLQTFFENYTENDEKTVLEDIIRVIENELKNITLDIFKNKPGLEFDKPEEIQEGALANLKEQFVEALATKIHGTTVTKIEQDETPASHTHTEVVRSEEIPEQETSTNVETKLTKHGPIIEALNNGLFKHTTYLSQNTSPKLIKIKEWKEEWLDSDKLLKLRPSEIKKLSPEEIKFHKDYFTACVEYLENVSKKEHYNREEKELVDQLANDIRAIAVILSGHYETLTSEGRKVLDQTTLNFKGNEGMYYAALDELRSKVPQQEKSPVDQNTSDLLPVVEPIDAHLPVPEIPDTLGLSLETEEQVAKRLGISVEKARITKPEKITSEPFYQERTVEHNTPIEQQPVKQLKEFLYLPTLNEALTDATFKEFCKEEYEISKKKKIGNLDWDEFFNTLIPKRSSEAPSKELVNWYNMFLGRKVGVKTITLDEWFSEWIVSKKIEEQRGINNTLTENQSGRVTRYIDTYITFLRAYSEMENVARIMMKKRKEYPGMDMDVRAAPDNIINAVEILSGSKPLPKDEMFPIEYLQERIAFLTQSEDTPQEKDKIEATQEPQPTQQQEEVVANKEVDTPEELKDSPWKKAAARVMENFLKNKKAYVAAVSLSLLGLMGYLKYKEWETNEIDTEARAEVLANNYMEFLKADIPTVEIGPAITVEQADRYMKTNHITVQMVLENKSPVFVKNIDISESVRAGVKEMLYIASKEKIAIGSLDTNQTLEGFALEVKAKVKQALEQKKK